MKVRVLIPGRFPWFLAAVFAALVAGLAFAGFQHFEWQKGQIRKQQANELAAIAGLKRNLIETWRAYRLDDGRIISGDAFLVRAFEEWLRHGTRKLTPELARWVDNITGTRQYNDVMIFDGSGRLRYPVEEVRGDAPTFDSALIGEALRGRKVEIVDLHRDVEGGAIHMGVAVPLASERDPEGPLAGLILLRLDPDRFLFSLIQSWPVPSSTAETLLVERQGEEVVFLNELRHARGTALNLRIPLSRKDIAGVKAALGESGFVEAMDYRGKRVLADVQAIPDSPWFIVAKIDEDEVIAPLRWRALLTGVVVLLIVVAAGAGILLWWQVRSTAFARRVCDAEDAEMAWAQRYELVVEVSGQVPYDYHVSTGVIEWRRNIETLLGFSAAEIGGFEQWKALLHPDDRQKTLEHLDRAEWECAYWDAEYRMRHRNGEYVWIRDRGFFVPDAQGKAERQLGMLEDITERKRAEEEIRNLNVTLEQRVAERTALLEAANEDREAFSYSVAHDLRAPLRAIDGFSRILLDEQAQRLDAEGKRLLGVIRGSTGQMGQLIDALLTFSSMGRAQMSRAAIDMTALARGIWDALAPEREGRDIDFAISDLPMAQGDREMIRIVITNLLSNAIKFTRPKKSAIIRLDGHSTSQGALFSVEDNGVGFDQQYVWKLFGVFQRLHSTSDFEGTGVGLALVKRIVKRHGGRVWAEGQVGAGATFYFTLPQNSRL